MTIATDAPRWVYGNINRNKVLRMDDLAMFVPDQICKPLVGGSSPSAGITQDLKDLSTLAVAGRLGDEGETNSLKHRWSTQRHETRLMVVAHHQSSVILMRTMARTSWLRSAESLIVPSIP